MHEREPRGAPQLRRYLTCVFRSPRQRPRTIYGGLLNRGHVRTMLMLSPVLADAWEPPGLVLNANPAARPQMATARACLVAIAAARDSYKAVRAPGCWTPTSLSQTLTGTREPLHSSPGIHLPLHPSPAVHHDHGAHDSQDPHAVRGRQAPWSEAHLGGYDSGGGRCCGRVPRAGSTRARGGRTQALQDTSCERDVARRTRACADHVPYG
jgi:hypothetical protein